MRSKLNFNIVDTHDFKTLGILDVSTYNPDIAIEEVRIEILPPGYKIAASPFFMHGALNVYNSHGVGITKASCGDELIDLPDGLWKIKYSICPNDLLYVERFFLKTDKILCKLENAFLSLDLNSCDRDVDNDKLEKLEEIEFFIKGAIAASNRQDAKLASDLYKKADNLLSEFLKNKGECPC